MPDKAIWWQEQTADAILAHAKLDDIAILPVVGVRPTPMEVDTIHSDPITHLDSLAFLVAALDIVANIGARPARPDLSKLTATNRQ